MSDRTAGTGTVRARSRSCRRLRRDRRSDRAGAGARRREGCGRRPRCGEGRSARRVASGTTTRRGLAFDVRASRRSAPPSEAASRVTAAIDFLVNCVGTQQIEPLAEVTEDAYDAFSRQPQGGDVSRAGRGERQIAGGRGGRQVHLLSVRAHARPARARLLVVLQHQGRAGAARPAARDGAGAPGHQREWRRADRRPHAHGSDWRHAEFRQQLLDRIPLGRIADLEDVGGPALFFFAPASAS